MYNSDGSLPDGTGDSTWDTNYVATTNELFDGNEYCALAMVLPASDYDIDAPVCVAC